MKIIRFLTTLLASLLFSTAVFAGVPSEDGKKDEGKAREVPIIVVRGKKIPVMYAPPKPIEITAIVGSGTVSCQPVSYQANQVRRNTETYE